MDQIRTLIVQENGEIKGISQTDGSGSPQPVDLSNLAPLVSGLNDSALARVASINSEIQGLKNSHQTALAAAEQKRRDDLAAQKTAHEEELARVRGQVAGSSARSLLSDLDGAFDALPEEVQLDFAADFSTVRNLLHTNKPRVAWRYVDRLAVPPELVATQTAIKGRIVQAFPEYFNEEGELIS